MQDTLMINYMPTPDFEKHVIIMCPRDLYNNKILKDNMEHLISLLQKYLNEERLLNANKSVLYSCKFDSERSKQNLIVEEIERRLIDINSEMNEGISPFYWKMYENVDTYDYDLKINIKADYVLVLEEK